VVEQYLLINGARSVGSVVVDEARIRGEGGSARPQLVIPATVAMSVRPDESALALTELRAALRPGHASFPQETIGRGATLDLTGGFLGWTRPDIESKNQIEMRIGLSTVDIEEFEKRRHQSQDGRAHFALFLDPLVEGVRHFNQQQPGQENLDKGPWDEPMLGMYSQRFTFWASTIQPLPLNIEMSQWVEAVLPGLGYDTLRLIEVRLPPTLPGHGAAGTEFDKARLAFDQRRYPDCVGACRGLINMWNRLLDSSKGTPMGAVIGDRLTWPEDDPRREFVTQTWVATLNIVNVSLHPEGRPVPQVFNAGETRLIFRQVALLSEFLSAVIE
jgi:hypothetical protein